LFSVSLLITNYKPAFCSLTDYIDQLLDTDYAGEISDLKKRIARLMEARENGAGDDQTFTPSNHGDNYIEGLNQLIDDIYQHIEKTAYLDKPKQDYLNQIQKKILERIVNYVCF
jgi:hypothetical protein